MRSLFKTLVPVALCSALAIGSANAAVIISTDNTAPVGVDGIDNFATTGALMDGMLVTVRLRDGNGNLFGGTVAWADTGPNSGAASTPLWTLSVDGDTFTADWNFTLADDITLLGFDLEGMPGLTFFDRSVSPSTDGSASGRDLSDFNPDFTVRALYSMPVFLTGFPPVLDLYAKLSVEFGAEGDDDDDRGVTGSFTFRQDTDNDIRRSQVPEPATLMLFGAGLAALGLSQRRKRTAQ